MKLVFLGMGIAAFFTSVSVWAGDAHTTGKGDKDKGDPKDPVEIIIPQPGDPGTNPPANPSDGDGGVEPAPPDGDRGDKGDIPGWEFRAVLARILPNVDFYIQELVDHIDNLTVTQTNGRMLVDIYLAVESVTVKLDEKEQLKIKPGEVYAVKFSRKVHFELYSRLDSVTIAKISGVTILAKLRFFPDGIYPKRLRLDTSTDLLKIWVRLAGGVLSVDANVSMRRKEFMGIDWVSTILRNIGIGTDSLRMPADQ